MKNKKILLLVALIFLAVSCDRNTPVVGLPTGKVMIDGHVINVQIAENETTREQGLSDVSSLGINNGMIFLFQSPDRYGFWMKDMNFPLDFIWILNDKVVQITSNLPAEPGVPEDQLQTYYPDSPVDSMIEVNAGWAARNYIDVGDPLTLTR